MANEWQVCPAEHDEWYMSAIPIRPRGAASWDWVALVPAEMADVARLIAAAPELMEACEAVGQDDEIDHNEGFVMVSLPTMRLVYDAIAKARGEQHGQPNP